MSGCRSCDARREHILNTEPRHLITSICEKFYDLGWVGGTGGSLSVRERKPDGEDLIYLTPSGVHKERILPEHLYVTLATDEKHVIAKPDDALGYKMSQCTPLFYAAYTMRNAGSVIHTHSTNAVMATLFCEQKGLTEFQITHQEMIKGIKCAAENTYAKYYDTITVPIIENTPEERDLKASLAEAIEKYPNTHAVLVKRHGLYVWGDTWEAAKAMCECYDYLFGMAVEMWKLGMNPSEIPPSSPYKDLSRTFK